MTSAGSQRGAMGRAAVGRAPAAAPSPLRPQPSPVGVPGEREQAGRRGPGSAAPVISPPRHAGCLRRPRPRARLGGPGRPRGCGGRAAYGGTLCTPAGLGGSRGRRGGGWCAPTHTHNPRACTAMFTCVCTCTACTQAARVHPHSCIRGCCGPSLHRGCSARAPVGPPAPAVCRHRIPGMSRLPTRRRAAGTRTSCAHMRAHRLRAPRAHACARARGHVWGGGRLRSSAVGPEGAVWGRPGGWGETFLAALVILSGSKSVPGMFLIPGSVPAPAAPAPAPPSPPLRPTPGLPARSPALRQHRGPPRGGSALLGGFCTPQPCPGCTHGCPGTEPGGGEAICSPRTRAGAHPRNGTPAAGRRRVPGSCQGHAGSSSPTRRLAEPCQHRLAPAATGGRSRSRWVPQRAAGGTGGLRGWGSVPTPAWRAGGARGGPGAMGARGWARQAAALGSVLHACTWVCAGVCAGGSCVHTCTSRGEAGLRLWGV